MRFEALGGDLLRCATEDVGFACGSSSACCLNLEGVPTTFEGSGASDCLFDGVRNDDEGVSRSKRPSTLPFFCGVGPMDLRCATGVS